MQHYSKKFLAIFHYLHLLRYHSSKHIDASQEHIDKYALHTSKHSKINYGNGEKIWRGSQFAYWYAKH